ncbi:hypothetical protein HHTV1_30 [Haloarcula hispanica tailed virus 1]|uniref:Uncharacterized protein n=1 Tax=Haloarcula hispanica tailed virus 1 TaxID=1273750 RepID=R4TMD1_9CAUD|nr:hypothetical protein M198_gp30 [Haloarcula hispanica tailed virus 1]AGM11328.1 hypothetical protein HHTV1_30 [Haloarcula hispanica tailed virus 1]
MHIVVQEGCRCCRYVSVSLLFVGLIWLTPRRFSWVTSNIEITAFVQRNVKGC